MGGNAAFLIAVGGLVALAIALVVAAVLVTPRPKPTPAMTWATANGIHLTETTGPPIELYLRNSAALRRVGAVGGIVIPPAVTAGTGLDLPVPGFIWILVGYLAGVVVAEVTLARVPADGRRSASLEVRRARDYLPRPLLVAQVLLPVVAVGLSVLVATVHTGAIDPMGVTAAMAGAGAVVAGPLAFAIVVSASLGERYLVRRPQPMVASDLVSLDDAMRSASVRRVAATTVAINALLLTTQFSAIAYDLEPGSTWEAPLWAGAVVVTLFAYLSWQWWVNRGWRVRRHIQPTIGGVA